MAPIYLDHHATTPLLPAAFEAMQRVQIEAYGNPASAHQLGRKARQLLEDARDLVAQHLGAYPEEVIFTSGATESNNLAIFGFAGQPPAQLVAAPFEHPCVVEPLKHLEKHGFQVDWLPVTPRGQVETAAVLDRVTDTSRLVCLMLANHETGAIQPVRHVAKRIPKSIFLHCDAAQAVGKIPVDFHDLSVVTMSFSAHKFGGPKGIGCLLLRKGLTLPARTFGGHQQQARRPGTEPVALAVGLATALDHAVKQLAITRAYLDKLRSRLLEQLRESVSPVVVNGPTPGEPDGLPSALNLSFPGCRADVLLMRLDLAGVACSTGSACSSGSLLPSIVLRSMNVPDEVLHSAIRFTLGPSLTEAEIDAAGTRIAECVGSVRKTLDS